MTPLKTLLRLQRLRLKLHGYDLDIEYRPGIELLVAGALSRSYVQDTICNNELEDIVELNVCLIEENINISKEILQSFYKGL